MLNLNIIKTLLNIIKMKFFWQESPLSILNNPLYKSNNKYVLSVFIYSYILYYSKNKGISTSIAPSIEIIHNIIKNEFYINTGHKVYNSALNCFNYYKEKENIYVNIKIVDISQLSLYIYNYYGKYYSFRANDNIINSNYVFKQYNQYLTNIYILCYLHINLYNKFLYILLLLFEECNMSENDILKNIKNIHDNDSPDKIIVKINDLKEYFKRNPLKYSEEVNNIINDDKFLLYENEFLNKNTNIDYFYVLGLIEKYPNIVVEI